VWLAEQDPSPLPRNAATRARSASSSANDAPDARSIATLNRRSSRVSVAVSPSAMGSVGPASVANAGATLLTMTLAVAPAEAPAWSATVTPIV
jgi:hypothetical protein